MRKSRSMLVVAMAFVVFVGNAALAGQVISVAANGPADYSTIKQAIAAAVDGDTVVVADGTYYESSIHLYGKAITVRSKYGPKDCIINSGGVRCFEIEHGETETSVIDGFTLTGGSIDSGGAIRIIRTSPTIKNCIITANKGTSAGGGINCNKGDPVIINCLIVANVVAPPGSGLHRDGGGIYCEDSNAVITNCTIANNTASERGGGIYCDNGSSPTITNSIIVGNSDSSGSGATAQIHGGSPSVSYTCVQGFAGNGNIDVDPEFVSGSLGDYYLNIASLCVNAGSDLASALELDSLTTRTDQAFDGGTVDMGYHYMVSLAAEITITPKTLNLSSNGTITCRILPPAGYGVGDIDTESISLQGQIAASKVVVNEHDGVVMAKFSRADAQNILGTGEVEVSVKGKLVNGLNFEGSDTITIIDKGSTKD